MKNVKSQIAISWNIHAYMPCNGFHPLYHALFDYEDQDNFSFNVVDEINFNKSLLASNYFNDVISKVAQRKKYFESKYSEYRISKTFLKNLSEEDLWLNGQIYGDVELHHTSPLTDGFRPFVLHCESFLPIFMPFAYQGIGFIEKPDDIRMFYEKLLASPNCLGIYSHIPFTLSQISSFFKNKHINSKLVLTKKGLSRRSRGHLQVSRAGKVPLDPIFLFTNSAHNSSVSFKLRGGSVVLLFAQRFIKGGGQGKFIFRCGKPSDKELSGMGVDLQFLAAAEANNQILWIDEYLSDLEQLNLFNKADFYLLPSLNLHSVSIMQAQTSGCVVIVTDTIGTECYVDDNINGIVLRGIRDSIWQTCPQTGILIDNHDKLSDELILKLADQLYKKVKNLLVSNKKYADIIANSQKKSLVEYSGSIFRSEFLKDVIEKLTDATKKKSQHKNIYPSIPIINSKEQVNRLLLSPVTPRICLDIPSGMLFWRAGVYWFVQRKNPTELPVGPDFFWSLIVQKKNRSIVFLSYEFDTNRIKFLENVSKRYEYRIAKLLHKALIYLEKTRLSPAVEFIKSFRREYYYIMEESSYEFFKFKESVVKVLKRSKKKVFSKKSFFFKEDLIIFLRKLLSIFSYLVRKFFIIKNFLIFFIKSMLIK